MFAGQRELQGLEHGLNGRVLDGGLRVSTVPLRALFEADMANPADVVALHAGDHGRPEILVAGDAAKLILEVGGDSRGRHNAYVSGVSREWVR